MLRNILRDMGRVRKTKNKSKININIMIKDDDYEICY